MKIYHWLNYFIHISIVSKYVVGFTVKIFVDQCIEIIQQHLYQCLNLKKYHVIF